VSSSVVIIGKKEEIIAFKGIGINPFFIKNKKEVDTVLLDIVKDRSNNIGIIIIPEDIFQILSSETISIISKNPLPILLPIPGMNGSTGFSEKRLKGFVERAIGSDVFVD
jgi:V/A-type H+-transporting ATPase subunit F